MRSAVVHGLGGAHCLEVCACALGTATERMCLVWEPGATGLSGSVPQIWTMPAVH